MLTTRNLHPRRSGEAGGITILVALMLLVLLTLAGIGMSRNSMREIVSSGFARQGAMTRDVADSGLEWAIYWMAEPNAAGAANSAQSLNQTMRTLVMDATQAGLSKDVITGAAYAPGGTPQPDMTLTGPAGTTMAYTLGITRMGKLPTGANSQGPSSSGYAPASGDLKALAMQPDLWAVRSDAQVTQGGVTFTHARESWVTTPVR